MSRNLKYKEFIQFCNKNKIELNMTSNEAILVEELINAIEDNLIFKHVMTTIGDRKTIFEKVHNFYRETNK